MWLQHNIHQDNYTQPLAHNTERLLKYDFHTHIIHHHIHLFHTYTYINKSLDGIISFLLEKYQTLMIGPLCLSWHFVHRFDKTWNMLTFFYINTLGNRIDKGSSSPNGNTTLLHDCKIFSERCFMGVSPNHEKEKAVFSNLV